MTDPRFLNVRVSFSESQNLNQLHVETQRATPQLRLAANTSAHHGFTESTCLNAVNELSEVIPTIDHPPRTQL